MEYFWYTIFTVLACIGYEQSLKITNHPIERLAWRVLLALFFLVQAVLIYAFYRDSSVALWYSLPLAVIVHGFMWWRRRYRVDWKKYIIYFSHGKPVFEGWRRQVKHDERWYYYKSRPFKAVLVEGSDFTSISVKSYGISVYFSWPDVKRIYEKGEKMNYSGPVGSIVDFTVTYADEIRNAAALAVKKYAPALEASYTKPTWQLVALEIEKNLEQPLGPFPFRPAIYIALDPKLKNKLKPTDLVKGTQTEENTIWMVDFKKA